MAGRHFWPLGLLAMAACAGGQKTAPLDAQSDLAAADAPPTDAAWPEDAAPMDMPPPDPVLATMILRPASERTMQHMECAGNAAGDGMVVWRETESGKHEIWSVRLGRDGQWRPPQSLGGVRPTTELDRLAVTVDAEGNALAVWNELDGPQAGVVSARSLPATGWSAPAVASPGWVLSMAGSPAGDAVAFGVVEGTPPTLLRFAPATGWKRDGELRPEQTGFFAAGAGASGRGVMLWNQAAGAGAHELLASEYAAGAWAAPLRVQDARPFDHPIPSVNATFTAGGSGLAVWDRGGELQGQLWAAASQAPGTWEPPRLLSDGDAPLWTTTPLVQDAATAMVSWQTGMPPRRKVWTALRRDGQWQDSMVMAEGAEADTAALAPSGEALVAWSTARRVYGRHYTPARGWGPAALALGENGGVADLCAFIDDQGHGWILFVNGGPQKLKAAPIAP